MTLTYCQVRIIGIVGNPPEVRKIGELQVAQISLGIRSRTVDSPKIGWVTVDCWDPLVRSGRCWHALHIVGLR